jgi:hypothetical protein
MFCIPNTPTHFIETTVIFLFSERVTVETPWTPAEEENASMTMNAQRTSPASISGKQRPCLNVVFDF